MNALHRLASFLVAGSTLLATSTAEIQLPAVISDGMVLQRESQVAIWGWSEPGTEVSVKGGWVGSWIAAQSTTADENGRWELSVLTPEASMEPTTLSIWTREESVEVANVRIGEVLLCSGQSNMEWTLRQVDGAVKSAEGLSDATRNYERTEIQFFTVQRRATLDEQDDCVGTWRAASGKDALECSAVAYFTACSLQDQTGVPIGLINSSWGGTPIRSWISRDVIERFPRHAETLGLVESDSAGAPPEGVRAFWAAVRAKDPSTEGCIEASFDDSDWAEEAQPSKFKGGSLGDHEGIAWYRRRVRLPEDWRGEELTLHLPAIDDLDSTYVNGQLVGSVLAKNGWTVPRAYDLDAQVTGSDELVITVCCLDTGGAGGFSPSGQMMLARGTESLELSGIWRVRKGLELGSVPSIPYTRGIDQSTPSALFSGMIAPVRRYGVRAALWYQGEADVRQPDEYRLTLPALIVDWRAQWGRDVPFYIVQIAPFEYAKGRAEHVARLRDAQAAALALPSTGLALTNDIGNPKDIHPKNKWDLGRRLALWVHHDHLGGEIDPMGPTPREVTPGKGSLELRFDHAAGGLRPLGEGPITGFEIAGPADSAWVSAKAELIEGGQLLRLTAEGVDAPTRARYLWDDASVGSLQNAASLPVAPFETE